MKGVNRLKRNENGFICEGFRLLGGKIFGQPTSLVEGLAGARPRPASTAILGSESRLARPRPVDWMTASFFSMAGRLSATRERRRASGESGRGHRGPARMGEFSPKTQEM